MIDVVAVLRPEDLVVDFLSVLESGREVHLVVAERRVYLKLPGGVPLAGRLAAVAELVQAGGDGDKPFSPGAAAEAIASETGYALYAARKAAAPASVKAASSSADTASLRP